MRLQNITTELSVFESNIRDWTLIFVMMPTSDILSVHWFNEQIWRCFSSSKSFRMLNEVANTRNLVMVQLFFYFSIICRLYKIELSLIFQSNQAHIKCLKHAWIYLFLIKSLRLLNAFCFCQTSDHIRILELVAAKAFIWIVPFCCIPNRLNMELSK